MEENITGFYQLFYWLIGAVLIPVFMSLGYHLNHFIHGF